MLFRSSWTICWFHESRPLIADAFSRRIWHSGHPHFSSSTGRSAWGSFPVRYRLQTASSTTASHRCSRSPSHRWSSWTGPGIEQGHTNRFSWFRCGCGQCTKSFSCASRFLLACRSDSSELSGVTAAGTFAGTTTRHAPSSVATARTS